jgi:hypothetical protein
MARTMATLVIEQQAVWEHFLWNLQEIQKFFKILKSSALFLLE